MDVDRRLIIDAVHYSIAGVDILKGVYLELNPGTVCGLLGSNGCGKSTLLQLAAGQLMPSSGSVAIDGRKFHRRNLRQRFREIAYLPQNSMLPRRLPVKALVPSLQSQYGLAKNDPILRKVLVARHVQDLSGGQLRLVELVFLLSLGRRYVLLDEPFTGVEPLIVEMLLERISRYVQCGGAVLLTDHAYRDVLCVSTHVYLMRGGTCRKLDSSSDLAEQLWEFGYI